MNIKSFGCSFIFGTDLSDDNSNSRYINPSQLTWPALLAKNFDIDYECFAWPGSGNLRILESIMSAANSSNSDDLFIISWTWIDRFDYTTVDDKWQTVLPVDTSKEADFYYRNFHSQYRDKLTSLIHIRTAVDILNQKKIPFIMTHIDNLIFETQWHCNDTVKELQKYVSPYMITFDGDTFLNWAQKHKFPISAGSHPLDQAHSKAAKHIASKIMSQTVKSVDNIPY